MSEDLTDLCNRLTSRIAAKLPKSTDVKPEQLTHAILGTVILEIAMRDSRILRAEKERDDAKAALAAFRAYLDTDFRQWCSPHGIAADYATKLITTLDELAGQTPSLDQGGGGNTVRWSVCPDCFGSHPGGAACYGEEAAALDEGAEATPAKTLRPDTGDGTSLPCASCSTTTPDAGYCCGLPYCDNCMAVHAHDGDEATVAAEKEQEALKSIVAALQHMGIPATWHMAQAAVEGALAFAERTLPPLVTGGPEVTTPEHEAAHADLEERFEDAATWTEEAT